MPGSIGFSPDLEIFRENYKNGKSQLVHHWISADLETPVSAYLKLCGHRAYSFLLESVEGGATLGRYSIIGTNPDLLWRCQQGGIVSTREPDGQWKTHDVDANGIRCASKSWKISEVSK